MGRMVARFAVASARRGHAVGRRRERRRAGSAIRASASRAASATPARGAQHGAAGEPAEAGRLLRSRGAGRRGRSAGGRTCRACRRAAAPPGHPRAGAPAHRPARPRQAAAASPTPISPSAATTSSSATTTASTPTTSRTRAGRGCSRRSSARAARATSRSTATCCSCRSSRRAAASTAARRACSTPVSAERFRGVRIFDITDLNKPKQVAAVQTCRGSHTHTLVDRPEGPGQHLRLRIGHEHGASRRGARRLFGQGSEGRSEHALFSIDVIKVPLAAPEKARDRQPAAHLRRSATGNIAGLWQGGDHGPGTQTSRLTNQCHDITVFPEIGLAAGACAGNGILMDISDPVNPEAARSRRRQELRLLALGDVQQRRHARSSSPTNGAAAGGRAAARPICRPGAPTRSSTSSIASCASPATTSCRRRRPSRRTASRTTARSSRCRAATSWCRRGIRAACRCSTSPTRRSPVEIAFFDRGPVNEKQLVSGGYWSTYWYNGYIYGAEIARGLDVFRLTAERAPVAERDRRGDAGARADVQRAAAAEGHVAGDDRRRARVSRSARAIERRARGARDRHEGRVRQGRCACAPARRAARPQVLDQLDAMAAELEKDAASATGRDAQRMRALAANDQGPHRATARVSNLAAHPRLSALGDRLSALPAQSLER